MVKIEHSGTGTATRVLLAVAGLVLSTCVAAQWSYPPYGRYGGPPQGGYRPPPGQSGYPGQPQGRPYQMPQGMPYQGRPQGMPYQGYPQGQPQAMPYQYRPVPPSNAQGVPPSYQAPAAPSQGYQKGWGGYGQRQAASQSPAPRLEWTLSQTQPYVQQNLLLKLRLISGESLTTADPELADSDDALIQKLSGPTSSTRTGSGGRQEVVTDFVLVVTPLHTGRLELPPPAITGTRPGPYGGSERYEAKAREPIKLQVRPAMTSVRPWLPLQALTLNASVDHPEQVRPGQPVTLALELSAEGAMAAQLPNLENQLTSPDFRVYREQTLTDSGLSKDGRTLVSRRTEYYTLVPQSGGNLRLPEISVPWWNVETGTREVAKLPIRTLNIAGGSGPFNLPTSILGGSDWSKVWMPLLAVLLLLAGYWGGVFWRRRQTGEAITGGMPSGGAIAVRLRDWLAQSGRSVSETTRTGLRRLHPAPLAGRAQTAAVGLLPATSRFLMVVRKANQAKDPAEWCDRFEHGARKHLKFYGKNNVPSMTQRILELRPRADQERVARLMEQLDAALYGRQDIDFPRWKRELNHQISRAGGLMRPRRPGTRIRRAHLPALNPSMTQ